jgi:hypothetical protein
MLARIGQAHDFPNDASFEIHPWWGESSTNAARPVLPRSIHIRYPISQPAWLQIIAIAQDDNG